MATTRSVIEQHIRAFNDQDTESEPWSQDAELTTPGGKFTGREGILGFFGVFQGAFSNGALTVNSWTVEGDRASVESVSSGIHDGVLQSPGARCRPPVSQGRSSGARRTRCAGTSSPPSTCISTNSASWTSWVCCPSGSELTRSGDRQSRTGASTHSAAEAASSTTSTPGATPGRRTTTTGTPSSPATAIFDHV